MQKGPLLYEGKAKRVYSVLEDNEDYLIIEYKDDATAFDGEKKEVLPGKGKLNNEITSILFTYLRDHGVKSHFVRRLSERESLVKRLEIIPVEVIVRNIVSGSIARRLGLEEGDRLHCPVLEFCLKNDALHDPPINHYHVYALKLASPQEMALIEKQALQINAILQPYFASRSLDLVDFKLEFGRYQGKVILGDEISPDTCRLWDSSSGKRLDKDRFRRDLGEVLESYAEILRRIREVGQNGLED